MSRNQSERERVGEKSDLNKCQGGSIADSFRSCLGLLREGFFVEALHFLHSSERKKLGEFIEMLLGAPAAPTGLGGFVSVLGQINILGYWKSKSGKTSKQKGTVNCELSRRRLILSNRMTNIQRTGTPPGVFPRGP